MADKKTTETLIKFKNIFAGAQDRFVIHVPPFKVSAESGKNTASFTGFAKYGSKSFKAIPDGFDDGDYVPCSLEMYQKHLNGELGVALSPLLPRVAGKDNVCYYGAIDIDMPGHDFMPLIRRLYSDGFKFASCLSKSQGLHLYFVFPKCELAVEVRKALNRLVNVYGLPQLYKKGTVSKVEVFPEHDERKESIKDKGVFLPFFNSVGKSPNSLLSADGKLVGIMKALGMIEKQRTTVSEINVTLDALPYGDAPYCIRALLMNGELYDGSCRNDFLFTAGLYLRLKHGADGIVKKMVEEMNDRFAEPLEQQHVDSVFNSVTGKADFPLLGQCKKSPMTEFCDKRLCKEQPFSAVKKEKNNVSSNVQFGTLYKMITEEPYYMLEVRPAEEPNREYVRAKLNDIGELFNQQTVQRAVGRVLNILMYTVKQPVWEQKLNDIMREQKEEIVPKATDTTDLGDLREHFLAYLTHGQAQSSSPFRITMKQVYFKDDVFYFRTEGLKEYLRIAKHVLGRVNLREQLKSYGCREGSVEYERRDGSKLSIDCWVKDMDDILRGKCFYYEELTDQDAMIIERNRLNKEDSDSGRKYYGEDTRF